jgi:hypothetical protein
MRTIFAKNTTIDVRRASAAAVLIGVAISIALLLTFLSGSRGQEVAGPVALEPPSRSITAARSTAFLEANTFLPELADDTRSTLGLGEVHFLEINTFLPEPSQAVEHEHAPAFDLRKMIFVERNMGDYHASPGVASAVEPLSGPR